MTKFNQERRLEDRHIAEKHHVLSSPTKGGPPRVATGRASHSSSRSQSTPAHSKGSRLFDVISSKIPRQQRTHATYRRDSDPSLSTSPPINQQPLESPSPDRQSRSASQRIKSQRSLGSDNGNQSSHSSAKQQVRQPSQRKALRSSPVRSQAQASAKLMLQANAVLEELDHSLLLAAEVASAEVAAAELAATAAARPSSGQNSKALPSSPVHTSPHTSSPRSPGPPRVVSSASPRDRMQSQEQSWRTQQFGNNPPVGPPMLSLQQRSFSVPTHQHPGTAPSTTLCSLAHTLAQLRQPPTLTPADSTTARDQHQQGPQQQGQLAQGGTINPPAALLQAKAEDSPPQPSSGAEDALPDAAQASEATLEPGHCQRPAGNPDMAPSLKRSVSGASGVSQGRSMQGVSGEQQLPTLDTKPVVESGSTAAVAPAETVDFEARPATSCREDLFGSALPSVLHAPDQTGPAGAASTLQPAASDTAASSKAVSQEPAVRPAAKAVSSPLGTLA
ncbi:hypothetical protein ABBQ32_001730 [Trebouxia sp. C0010 RCD-2024]